MARAETQKKAFTQRGPEAYTAQVDQRATGTTEREVTCNDFFLQSLFHGF